VSHPIKDFFQDLKQAQSERRLQGIARRAGRGKTARSYVSQPLPLQTGFATKGLQLAAGNFLVDGHLVQEPDSSIWEIGAGDADFILQAHSFDWLAHLGANGSPECHRVACLWLTQWVAAYGDGENRAWAPDLAGPRLIALLNNALFLMSDAPVELQETYFKTVTQHARFLKKTWGQAPVGLPRFQALVGYFYATLAIEELARDLPKAHELLAQECTAQIDENGGVQTRCPEDLFDIFALLIWTLQGMEAADIEPNKSVVYAADRSLPLLRMLRLGDGSLAKFHGGDTVPADRMDAAFVQAGTSSQSMAHEGMGYARLEAGNFVAIVDMGGMPDAQDAHYGCALSFEMSVSGQPLFTNTGTGRGFGAFWQENCMRPSAFNVASVKQGWTKGLDPVLARFAPDMNVVSDETANFEQERLKLSGYHTGYQKTLGLVYNRCLSLDAGGNTISGQERFYCQDKADRKRFDQVLTGAGAVGIPVAIRFHVAPDVDVSLDLGGKAVSMAMKNGDIWILKADRGEMDVFDSVHFEIDRLKPRATKQIVVYSGVVDYEDAVNWTLTRL